MASAAPKPIASLDRARRIPERRARSLHKRGILLIIDHAHVARVLELKAEQDLDGPGVFRTGRTG